MFALRERRAGRGCVAEVAFTDRWGGVSDGERATLDLRRSPGSDTAYAEQNLALVAAELGVAGFATMRQVHGADVTVVGAIDGRVPDCDALVTRSLDVALCVRVGDCVPVVLSDVDAAVAGVAHAGRPGVAAGVVTVTVAAMRALGAETIVGWVGPHVCGGCYEVPADMRAEVAGAEPAAFACTTWGTPSLDLGAAVAAQLARGGCEVQQVARCTREDEGFFSHRRQGPDAGRQAGLVVLRAAT